VLLSLVSPQSGLWFWGFTNDLLITVTLIVIVRWWEKNTWSSIGISCFSLADLFLGVGAFFVWICFLSPLDWITGTVLLARAGVQASRGGGFDGLFWFLASIGSGVLFEELAHRAYLVERVIEFTGARSVAGAASFCFSLALHIPSRSLKQTIEVAPLLLILTVLYVWRRNMVPGLIVHFLVNIVPLLAALLTRHAKWLIKWVFVPQRIWITLAAGGALYLVLNCFWERVSRFCDNRVCR
jgi:membrane protease YdiL (CAAX protease family)